MKWMRNRLLSWVLTLAMVLAMVPAPFGYSYGAVEIAQQEMNISESSSSNVLWHGSTAEGRSKIGLYKLENAGYGGRGTSVFDLHLSSSKQTKSRFDLWSWGRHDSITTYGDRGYASVAKIGDSVIGGKQLSVHGTTDIGSGISVEMSFTGMANANIIRVGYHITNTGSADKTISVGGTADTDIAGDDEAKIETFENGNAVGMISTARGGEYLAFTTDSNYWYGKWNQTQKGTSFAQFVQKAAGVKGKDPSLREKDGRYDSCISWIWQNVNVPAGATVTKYCYFGVGDLTLGDDPYVIKTAAATKVTWDANAYGEPVEFVPDPEPTAETNKISKVEDGKVTLPNLVRTGYALEGWFDKPASGNKVGDAGDIVSGLTEDAKYYAHWKAIVSTVNINLKMGSDPYGGQSMQLYSGNTLKYNLTETETPGTYSVAGVLNGTYSVGVNGAKTGDTITVTATGDSSTQTKDVTVTLAKAEITTKLDGANSNVPGEVTLRQDGKIVYTLTEQSAGVWAAGVLISTGGKFDVFVGGADTGVDLTASSLAHTISFHNATVNVTDDAAWTTASVTLRDASGRAVASLPLTGTAGNTATYSCLMQDTDAELSVDLGGLDTGKKMGGTNGYTANITCYTATLNVTCSDVAGSPLSATMTGGGRSYAFKKTSDGVYTVEHVFAGPDYTVDTKGVSKEGVTAETMITDASHTKALTVWVVNFKKYTTTDGNTFTASDSGTKGYVLDGGTVKAAESHLQGFTFGGWSTAAWSKNESSYTAFDFTSAITSDKTLYPHFLPPTVKINAIIRTNNAGVEVTDGTDTAYRLGNLAIAGFDRSDESIKYMIFSATNVERITTLGELPAGATFEPISGILTFDTPVSMETAQTIAREKILFKPKNSAGQNADGSVTVTVIDAYGTIDSANSAEPAIDATGIQQLTSSTTGKNLSSGFYYVDQTNVTCTNNSNGGSGIKISGTVYIYIKSGCTLTATGKDANGSTGAGAGINVPSGNTLYLLGEGAVVATGGDAANGGNGGENKQDALIYGTSDGWYRCGTGGSGGNGGGGAGAGIGGAGGNGGSGGAGRVNKHNEAGLETVTDGKKGEDGGAGAGGKDAGTVYIGGTLTVTATGGAAGSNGTSPSRKTGFAGFYSTSYDASNDNWDSVKSHAGYCSDDKASNWGNYYCAGPGGVGGYGSKGGAAADVGGGGYGGGGGGAGGSGAESKVEGRTNVSSSISGGNMSCGGAGGNGGNTAGAFGTGGSSGTTATGYTFAFNKTGGMGGSGGRAGNNGSNGTITIASTATLNGNSGSSSETVTMPTFTITYNKAATGDTIDETGITKLTSYTYGTPATLVLPGYFTSGSDRIFRGWMLTQYGVNPTGGGDNPFTSGADTLYQGGTTLTIPGLTAGNLVFDAVTGEMKGVRATDTTAYQATVALKKTYTVTTTVDGEPHNVGVLTFEDTEVKGLEGVYTYSTTDDNVTVKHGENLVTEMAATNANPQAAATAAFENAAVTVTGYKPSDVTLSDGENPGPILARTEADDDNKVYHYESEYRLVAEEKGNYSVRVDGNEVEKTTAYGQDAQVAYNTITINLAPSKARNVILKAADGTTLVTQKVGSGESNTFTFTKLADAVTTYDVYADGTLTGATGVTFGSTRTVNASYYLATVNVTLDGVSTAAVGIPQFGDEPMVEKTTGTYTFASASGAAQDLLMNGDVVREAFAADATTTLDYFSVTYAKTEGVTGDLPHPTYCLLGATAPLAPNPLKNGDKNFAGWDIGGAVYKAGAEFAATAAVTATATWAVQSLSELTPDGYCSTIVFDTDTFGYNGAEQKPNIEVYMGSTLLTKDTHYTVEFTSNSNPDTGAGSITERAGTVTVTIKGIGDYGGAITKTYEILPRLIHATFASNPTHAYDGSTAVTLNKSQATLEPVVDGDSVSIAGDLKGTLDDAEVEEGKAVRIDDDVTLTGTHKSNYILTHIEGVKVDVTPKTVTIDSIGVYNKAYDGTTAATIIPGSARLSGVLAAEKDGVDVELTTEGAATFASAAVGTGKTVNITGLALVGPAAGHYTLASSSKSTTANIMKASQTAPAPGEGYNIENGKIVIDPATNPGSTGTHYEIIKIKRTPGGEDERTEISYSSSPVVIDNDATYYIRWSGNGEFEPSPYTEMITDVMAGKSLATLPQAVEDLKYTGLEQTGVPDGTGYTLSGTVSATEPGIYVAIATLEDGYVWPDGTTEPKTIRWSIEKAPQSRPLAYEAEKDTNNDGNPNKVIIYPTDKPVEYSLDEGKTWITLPRVGDEFPGEFFDMTDSNGDGIPDGNAPAGTYWIRYKGDDEHEASPAVIVDIGAQPVPPTTKPPVEIGTTTAKLDIGTDETYKYRKKGEEVWLTANTNMSGLAPDTEYEIYAIKDGQKGRTLTFRTNPEIPPTEDVGAIGATIDNLSDTGMDVAITVEYGNDAIAANQQNIASGSSGSTEFTHLPYGNYNVVVRAGDFTETRMVSISGSSRDVTVLFTIPSGKLATLVQVTGADTPNVAVDGLNDILSAEDRNNAAIGAEDVEVKLEVEKMDGAGGAQPAEGAAQIQALAGGATIDTFLDITLYKTTKELDSSGDPVSIEKKDIGKTNTKVIEIAVPCEDAKTKTILVYRYHNGVAGALKLLSARPSGGVFTDGTYYVDKDLGYVFIYASGFSTYAIATKGGGNGGAGGGVMGDGTETGVVTGPVQAFDVCPKDETCPISRFTDANPKAWYHDGVHYVLEHGIMQGMGGTIFAPGGTTTRAMMAQILYNMQNRPDTIFDHGYIDVKKSSWYEKAVAYMTEKGIMDGYGRGLFGPNDPVTREQLVAIIYRYAKFKGIDVSASADLAKFKDGKNVSTWAKEAMSWAVAAGVVSGRTATAIVPLDSATRAEIATIIMRYCEDVAK